MRGRGPYKLTVTNEQKVRLEYLTALLAEKGYKVFSVSEPMCRSTEDLIATSTDTVICAIIIRPTRNNKIELRCFQHPAMFNRLKTYIKENKSRYYSTGPLIFGRQLPFGEQTLGWAQYVHPDCHQELKMLYGEDILKPQR